MIRAVAIHLMILISLFSFWSVGYASQIDDCCIERLSQSTETHVSETKSKAVATIAGHPDDCAARCDDCVICQSQCNQHGVVTFVTPEFGFDLAQAHDFTFVHSYSDIDPTVLKEPPRA
ncbi:hypothetical protein [Bdellovibrio sp. KM01]|uniref:hypothetical protein n=1 Tax=Bdellovibrio sp. KM01 TaxID=2748865 RepID=UPI0015EAC6A4|nr:hypothetical protein [Bdellovibrio sp. KM01]QLY26347.1 hypothetical protein HW988_04785 [Bdellovibrio sp. KM01]